MLGWSITAIAQYPSEYNVVWNTPSSGSHESMPCGGGSIGANVWVEAEVSLESWRHEDFLLRKDESHSNSYKFAPPAGLRITKDVIDFEENAVCFYHRNPEKTVFDVAVERQGMTGVKSEMM